jgi:hypothetical protein
VNKGETNGKRKKKEEYIQAREMKEASSPEYQRRMKRERR